LVTVIEIEAKQYAKIDMGGLFVIFEKWKPPPPDLALDPDRKGSRAEGEDRPLKFRISISGILML